jgi:hypothetical protein
MPPEPHADLVAPMEDVVALSPRPYDPRHPLVNMEAKPGQLRQAPRTPVAAKPGKPQRYDYAYERGGTATVLLCTEPRTGWRTIDLTAHRTAVDWAHPMKHRLDDG